VIVPLMGVGNAEDSFFGMNTHMEREPSAHLAHSMQVLSLCGVKGNCGPRPQIQERHGRALVLRMPSRVTKAASGWSVSSWCSIAAISNGSQVSEAAHARRAIAPRRGD
jgi:hypothetical protein